jgi:hypothetical protein
MGMQTHKKPAARVPKEADSTLVTIMSFYIEQHEMKFPRY